MWGWARAIWFVWLNGLRIRAGGVGRCVPGCCGDAGRSGPC